MTQPAKLRAVPKKLVEGEGFEPSKAEPTDLQSAPFDRSGTPPNETGHYSKISFSCQTTYGIWHESCSRAPDVSNDSHGAAPRAHCRPRSGHPNDRRPSKPVEAGPA